MLRVALGEGSDDAPRSPVEGGKLDELGRRRLSVVEQVEHRDQPHLPPPTAHYHRGFHGHGSLYLGVLGAEDCEDIQGRREAGKILAGCRKGGEVGVVERGGVGPCHGISLGEVVEGFAQEENFTERKKINKVG